MPTGDVSGPRMALGMTLLVIGRNLMPFLYGVLVMVFLFSAARGKDLSAGEHISVALSRIGRCIWASIQTWFVTVIPFALAVGVSFAIGNGFVIFLVFSTGLAWMFYMFNEFWLVIPVAAMGPEEEPGNVLARSRQLVGVDRWRVWRGTMFTALVLGFSVMLSMLFVSFVTLMLPGYWMRMAWETFGIVLTTAVTLLMPIYQALLYFECRRALEKDFLKYAPEGMTGTDRA